MEIVGMKKFYYVGNVIDGHNCEFTSHHEILPKYAICIKDIHNNKKYELELKETSGECYSGWTTARWGQCKCQQVTNFDALTHVPMKEYNKSIAFSIENIPKNFKCIWFQYSKDGGDEYYPSGYVSVDETGRGFNTKPVWVFQGSSNMGKSFLAHKLNNMKIYETDSNKELPENIFADVVVVGNKYNHDLNEIKKRICGETIDVSFK